MDKQAILSHFNGNFVSFYSKFCGDLYRAGMEFKAHYPYVSARRRLKRIINHQMGKSEAA